MAGKPPKKKPTGGQPKSKGKTPFAHRITTGRDLFPEGVDERTRWPRLVRDNYLSIVSDLGGPEELTKLQAQLARRAAVLDCFAIHMEAKAAAGEQVDLTAYATLCNVFLRISSTLGLKRSAPEELSLRERLIVMKGKRGDG